MSKDNNSKWNFVEMPANVPSRSGEDSTFDHFRSNHIASSCENSYKIQWMYRLMLLMQRL